jgi:branched-chain amino acid transport system permease protein
MGSLAGAFVASLAIGVIQTFAVGIDTSIIGNLKISQIAPILPYMFLVLMLIFRPKGLLGTREG